MGPSGQLFARAVQATAPVLVGYFPLGLAFGVLFADFGYSWTGAFLMGLVVYAGAAQFLAVGLLAAGAGLVEIAVATFILNSRHAFFGLSLLERWRTERTGRLRKLYLMFALTDETYALVSTLPAPEDGEETRFHLVIAALNQSAWVTGCTTGAVLGRTLVFDTTGLDFALTALFGVLVIEQIREVRAAFPFALALAAGLGCLVALGPEDMLLASIVLSMALLIADGARRGWA